MYTTQILTECIEIHVIMIFNNSKLTHIKNNKMVLDASLLNTQHYKLRIKGKWSNPRKGVAPSSTPRRSSYWKENLRVVLDNSWPSYYFTKLNLGLSNTSCIQCNVLNCGLELASSNSIHATAFPVRLMPLGKIWTPFIR